MQDTQITLPQSATLILQYDIPDDLMVAQCFLNFRSQNLDQAIWKDTSFGLSPVITNRSEVILTNLTPGNYELGRRKILKVGNGSRFQFLDNTNLVLKPGETRRVDIVRPVGQAVRGQVTGIQEAHALGAYLYACVGEITNTPISSWNPGPLVDLGTCGKDGAFQMARFPPGNYSIVAMSYKNSDVYNHSGEADFIGVGTVKVTADAPTQPVKIELVPYGKYNRDTAARATNASVQATNANPAIASAASRQSGTAVSVDLSFSGLVVDDAAGKPIIDLVVQRGRTNFAQPQEIQWGHYMMGNAQRPGAWFARLENGWRAVRILPPAMCQKC